MESVTSSQQHTPTTPVSAASTSSWSPASFKESTIFESLKPIKLDPPPVSKRIVLPRWSSQFLKVYCLFFYKYVHFIVEFYLHSRLTGFVLWHLPIYISAIILKYCFTGNASHSWFKSICSVWYIFVTLSVARIRRGKAVFLLLSNIFCFTF